MSKPKASSQNVLPDPKTIPGFSPEKSGVTEAPNFRREFTNTNSKQKLKRSFVYPKREHQVQSDIKLLPFKEAWASKSGQRILLGNRAPES